MPHFPHYSPPPPPPYRPPPPYHPPPPPVPLEAINDDAGPGPPRCYFCGKQITSEADVRKTVYHVGHGQKILVMICPVCAGKKARGEPPFRSEFDPASLLGCVVFVVFIAFVIFILYTVVRPIASEQDRPRLGPPDPKRTGFRP